ncbi:hypothetical protein K435DRAFT_812631 [Dendrothele bispora CBS 962.96]|uniref:Uncharacterized protein n=1 Tax=Dendrothele bispora (strain CBS 962.96) TaxID=1314807 RepID=A0A4S8KNN2_DENBC|nr:hypothetical protein K435DRAFT_812631 [Dendrothele bispora CBS 962.96]
MAPVQVNSSHQVPRIQLQPVMPPTGHDSNTTSFGAIDQANGGYKQGGGAVNVARILPMERVAVAARSAAAQRGEPVVVQAVGLQYGNHATPRYPSLPPASGSLYDRVMHQMHDIANSYFLAPLGALGASGSGGSSSSSLEPILLSRLTATSASPVRFLSELRARQPSRTSYGYQAVHQFYQSMASMCQ